VSRHHVLPPDVRRRDRRGACSHWLLALCTAEIDVAFRCRTAGAPDDDRRVSAPLDRLGREHSNAAELLAAKAKDAGLHAAAMTEPAASATHGAPRSPIVERLIALQRDIIALAAAYQKALNEPDLDEPLRYAIATRLVPTVKAHLVTLDELIELVM
jgi:hypothetical protein